MRTSTFLKLLVIGVLAWFGYDRVKAYLRQNEQRQEELFQAVRTGNVVEAKRLIDAGADVNTANQNGIAPIHIAMQLGDVAMVKLLKDNGAQVTMITPSDRKPPGGARGPNPLERILRIKPSPTSR